MKSNSTICKAITKAHDYIYKRINQDIYLGYQTIFPLILVGDTLVNSNSFADRKILKKISTAVYKQKNDSDTFNYWIKESNKNITEPYPDDWDDTACALAFLYSYDPNTLSGKIMAKITSLLTLTEICEGGPYKTWIIGNDPKQMWSDVDIAVNNNIAYFLSCLEIELPPLTTYIELQLKQNNLQSPYYKGNLPTLYFMSRWYKSKYTQLLEKRLVDCLHKNSSSLTRALVAVSLLNIASDTLILSRLINSLEQSQSSDGTWAAADFYYYASDYQNRNYIRDKVITTAYASQALSMWKQKQGLQLSLSNHHAASNNKITQWYIKPAKKIRNLSEPLQSQCLQAIEYTKKIDIKHQGVISQSPLMIAKILKSTSIHNKSIIEKSVFLSIYGWTAYTVIDDIIDEDKETTWLSTGLFFYNQMLQAIYDISSELQDNQFLRASLDYIKIMESANAWENKYFDISQTGIEVPVIPSYIKPYSKSLGHILAPISIMINSGFKTNTKELMKLISFFKHFLNARQLHDDAHDWKEDLQKSRLNYISIDMLACKRISKFFPNIIPSLEEYFWTEYFPIYLMRIESELNAASKDAYSLHKILDDKSLEMYLVPLKQATKNAKKQHQTTIEYLSNSNY